MTLGNMSWQPLLDEFEFDERRRSCLILTEAKHCDGGQTYWKQEKIVRNVSYVRGVESSIETIV